MKICVIGAGLSGLVTIKEMKLAPLVDKLTFGRLGRALANRRPAPLVLLKQELKQKNFPQPQPCAASVPMGAPGTILHTSCTKSIRSIRKP